MSNIFRDPTEGATARRADLLRRRRDELVTMPHAIRRVYVARRARVAASVAVSLLGAAMLVIALKPAWTAFLAKGLPGINPAVLCTIIVAMWIIGMFAYVAARALDEHRFAVAMSRFVMPSKDLDNDLERLSHENPDQAARDMAHRLEVRSAALPVLAAGVLLPVTALYIAAAIHAGGWPKIAEFEATVATNAKLLAVCAGIGAVAAIVMTKRFARLPVVAPGATLLALIATAGVTMAPRLELGSIALVLATIALVVRRLRIERDQLQAEDPAAGSEVFTIRGFIRQLRASVAPVIARVRSVKPVWVLVAGLLIIAGVTAMKLLEVRETHPQLSNGAVEKPTLAAALEQPALGPSGSMTTVESTGDGRLFVKLYLADDKPFDIPTLAGLSHVPWGWMARFKIKQQEGMALNVLPVATEGMFTVSIGTDVTLTRRSCDVGLQPLSLRVQGEPGHYVLYVEPVLTPADC